MSTEKQRVANRLNAGHAAGPVTAAGKEASAANALKHGITAKKYVTRDEDSDEFQTLYAARRKYHAPDDPIINGLVRKITIIHWRFDRTFEAEADLLTGSSLENILGGFGDNRLKNLLSYEASSRKTLKLLEDELTRYETMLAEAAPSSPASAVTGAPRAETAAPKPPTSIAATTPPAP